jgi:CubicO group peptidase (beta-lactamase class C family)
MAPVIAGLGVSIVLGACGSGGAAVSNTTTVAPAETTTAATEPTPRSIDSVSVGHPDGEPGCAVGVADEADAATTAFGVADLDTGAPIEAATLFDLGSISKQFTGAVILGLVDEDVLTLDDTVRSWLPEVVGPAGDVTLRQLLHHRSGIPDYVYLLLAERVGFDVAATQADAIETVATAPLEFEPGRRFEYSNSNYMLLAEVAQRAAGRPFAELVDLRSFEPAGMATALLSDYASTPPFLATSYAHDGPAFVAHHWRWSPFGDGAIHASLEDMLAWGRHLLRHVDPFIADTEPAGSGRRYGAGVWVEEVDGQDVVWHSGGWQGFVSYFAVIPDEGLTVAVLCNRADADWERVARDALGAWRSSS